MLLRGEARGVLSIPRGERDTGTQARRRRRHLLPVANISKFVDRLLYLSIHRHGRQSRRDMRTEYGKARVECHSRRPRRVVVVRQYVGPCTRDNVLPCFRVVACLQRPRGSPSPPRVFLPFLYKTLYIYMLRSRERIARGKKRKRFFHQKSSRSILDEVARAAGFAS